MHACGLRPTPGVMQLVTSYIGMWSHCVLGCGTYIHKGGPSFQAVVGGQVGLGFSLVFMGTFNPLGTTLAM
jgi:hypothetical protein